MTIDISRSLPTTTGRTQPLTHRIRWSAWSAPSVEQSGGAPSNPHAPYCTVSTRWGLYLNQVGLSRPVASRHYPGSSDELLAWFPDDGACRDYLDWLRWRDGWRCPLCVSRDGWMLANGRRECARCGRQTSVTAGTIFHHARSPLRVWFAAAWLMTSQKYGVSALGLQRALGLGSPDGVGDAAPLSQGDGAFRP